MNLLQIGLASLTILANLSPNVVLNFTAGPAAQAVAAEVVELKDYTLPEMIVAASAKYDIDPDLALKIAVCESNLRQYDATGQVVRGKSNPADIGLFQVNEKYHLSESQKLGFDIYDAQGNIDYAMYILNKEGPRHWKYSKKCWG